MPAPAIRGRPLFCAPGHRFTDPGRAGQQDTAAGRYSMEASMLLASGNAA